jgi:hypothetical protein
MIISGPRVKPILSREVHSIKKKIMERRVSMCPDLRERKKNKRSSQTVK